MLCRLVQMLTSAAGDSGKPAPRWCRRHAARCPHCRHELEIEFALGDQLRTNAVGARLAPPPYLAARAVNAVKTAEPLSHRRHMRMPLWLKSAAAAVAAVLFLAVWHGRRPPIPSATPSTTTLAGLPLPLPAVWTPPDGSALLELSAMWDDPLRRELELVLADARAAGRSLAAAFLPASPKPSAAE